MFSMILATPRVEAPAHQKLRLELPASSARPVSSNARWKAMVRRM